MIEVPLRALVDLLDLSDLVVDQVEPYGAPVALIDALRSASAQVRASMLIPC